MESAALLPTRQIGMVASDNNILSFDRKSTVVAKKAGYGCGAVSQTP